jgi:hypothetical protein
VTTTTFHCSETFRRYKANLAATATVKAATGMMDDDNDVPLFDEKACAKNTASLHATGMSDNDNDVPWFDKKARANHTASLHATGMSVDEDDALLMKMLKKYLHCPILDLWS